MQTSRRAWCKTNSYFTHAAKIQCGITIINPIYINKKTAPVGTVSIIAQTGNFATHTMKYILSGEPHGVCRVIGLGNKVDLDESDALEYLADEFVASGFDLRALIRLIVATDAYGNLADGNLGEFLKRVPGIGVGDLSVRVAEGRGDDEMLGAGA